MKSTRILFVLFAIMLAGALVSFLVEGRGAPESAENPTSSTTPPGASDSDPWPIHGDLDKDRPTAEKPKELDEELPELDLGTPVADGASVDGALAYRSGRESHYRLAYTTHQLKRGTNLWAARRYTEGVKLVVLSAGKGKPTRIRLTREWFEFQVLGAPQLSWEFKSRDPDTQLLEAHPLARAVSEPLLAQLGVAIEIELDSSGRAIRVEGADLLADKFSEALVRLGQPTANAARPTEDLLLSQYGGLLFPEALGGTFKPKEQRDWSRRIDSGVLAWITFDGKLEATHDDADTFAVQTSDVAVGHERVGGNRLPNGANLAGVRVHTGKAKGAWLIDRAAGRLIAAQLKLDYELWTSFHVTNGSGEPDYEQHYDIIEQLLTADLVVEDEASTGGGEPEKTAAGPKKDEEGDTPAKDETPNK
jgi:hypothetical protein